MSAAVATWLVEAVRSETYKEPGLTDGDLAELTWASEVHGVPGYARRRADAERIAVPGLAELVQGAVARHQRALVDLRAVDDAFRRIDVQWLVVKGPALIDGYYGTPVLRSSVDLDVLVPPAAIPAAVKSLEHAGFILLDGNWPLLRSEQVRELRVQSPTGGAVDLHWSLVPNGVPSDGRPSFDELLAKCAEITLAGRPVRTTSWEDTLVHLAAHAAASGGHRLVWVADLRRVLAARQPVNWPLLLRTAMRWRSGPATALMLLRSRRTLHVDVPDSVLHALAPSAHWSRLIRLVERVDPFERVGTSRSLSRIVARACRESSSTSFTELRRRTTGAARPLPSRNSAGPSLDPGDPMSALFRVGGMADRERFLAEVARDQIG